MLKKVNPIVYIFVPFIIAYLNNYIILALLQTGISILYYLYIYGLLFGMVSFWFWVGRKFAQRNYKLYTAILLGNSMGIISLALYIWQFMMLPGESRSLFFASISQMFSNALYVITAKVGMLFEPKRNYYGIATVNAMQIIGFICLVLIFAIGYSYEKNKARKCLN